LEETLDLRQIIQILIRRKAIIITLFIASVMVAFISSKYMTKIYVSTATILVNNSTKASEFLFLDNFTELGGNKVQNYVEVLRSRTLAKRAMESLGYNYDIYSSEFSQFRNSISIQPVTGTENIRISVQSEIPEEAARIANAMVYSFIEFTREMNQEQARNARLFIEEQLSIVASDLVKSETMLQMYREEERVLAPTEETRIILNQLTQLQTQKAEMEMAKYENNNKIEEIRKRLSQEDSKFVYSTSVINNPMLSTLKQRLTQLEAELAGIKTQYSPQHPSILALQAQINEVEVQMANEVEQIISGETITTNPIYQSLLQELISLEINSILYSSNIEALDANILKLDEQLVELPEKELTLARLTRDLNVTEQIYLLLRNKYEEIRIQEAMQTANVTLIDEGIIPKNPIKPNVKLNLTIAGVLGLFVGIGLVFFLEYLDTSIKTPEELEAALGLPVMGRIPICHERKRNLHTGTDS
jgi:succinoglycan biosynthesis transport protein ExoP